VGASLGQQSDGVTRADAVMMEPSGANMQITAEQVPDTLLTKGTTLVLEMEVVIEDNGGRNLVGPTS
jgi:hypothetical protein